MPGLMCIILHLSIGKAENGKELLRGGRNGKNLIGGRQWTKSLKDIEEEKQQHI